jgi:drug/metabolite transporter (DMT)-like permease
VAAEPRPAKTALILAFITIYLIWGSTYLGIRVAVESIPPFLMVFMRFLTAGSILFLFLKARGAAWPTGRQWAVNAVSGIVLLWGGNALVAVAEREVPSALTSLVLASSPIFMVLLDWLRPGGSRPTAGIWGGIVVGLIGAFVLLGPGAFPEGHRPPTFDILILFASSLCWCAGSLYSKYVKSDAPPMMGAAIQMLSASVVIGLTSVVLGEPARFSWVAVTRPSFLALGYLIVAGSLIAYPVYVWLLKNASAARVSTYAYVNPVVAVILGWAILGEPMTARIAVAGAIIIVAVVIITVQRSRAKPAVNG